MRLWRWHLSLLIYQLETPYIGPLILLASCISFGIIVTLFAWIAHKLQSSNKCTKKSSEDSCNANNASAVHRIGWSVNSLQISRTSLAKGSFRINKSVDFWYFLISRIAKVPGLYLRFCGINGPVCSAFKYEKGEREKEKIRQQKRRSQQREKDKEEVEEKCLAWGKRGWKFKKIGA